MDIYLNQKNKILEDNQDWQLLRSIIDENVLQCQLCQSVFINDKEGIENMREHILEYHFENKQQ